MKTIFLKNGLIVDSTGSASYRGSLLLERAYINGTLVVDQVTYLSGLRPGRVLKS